MPTVHISTDAEQLAQDACEWVVQRITAHQSESSQPFSLALSGGSTPKRLYQLLAEETNSQGIDWNRVVLLWGDERTVPWEHSDSNYRMVKENLLDAIPIPTENVLGVPSPDQDPQSVAEAYEQLLRQSLPGQAAEAKTDFPPVDCVLLGMGDDVHTASLFPGTSALQESQRWVVANWVEKLNTWRITLTAPFINSAKHIAFLIGGKNKTDALRHLWESPKNPEQFPSQLIAPQNGELRFMLDQPAVGDLELPDSLTDGRD